MRKQLEQPSSFIEQISPVAPRRAAGDTYVGLDMLEKAVGWSSYLKRYYGFSYSQSQLSPESAKEGRGTRPPQNTSVSPHVQLFITASVTGFSFRGSQKLREDSLAARNHTLSPPPYQRQKSSVPAASWRDDWLSCFSFFLLGKKENHGLECPGCWQGKEKRRWCSSIDHVLPAMACKSKADAHRRLHI